MNIFEYYLNKINKIILDNKSNLNLNHLDDLKNVNLEVPPEHINFDLSSNVCLVLSKANKINPNQFYDCLNEIQLSFFGKYLKGGENFNPINISKKYSFMKEDKAQR